MALPLLAAPVLYGAAASAFAGVSGWVLGFFHSDSIKNLTWAAVIIAIVIGFLFLNQMFGFL